jgi:hypothetical protein
VHTTWSHEHAIAHWGLLLLLHGACESPACRHLHHAVVHLHCVCCLVCHMLLLLLLLLHLHVLLVLIHG